MVFFLPLRKLGLSILRPCYIFVLVTGIAVPAYAGNEQVLRTLNGPAIVANATLNTSDQQYTWSYPSGQTPYLPTSSAQILLRFDDSKSTAYTYSWSMTVNYSVTTYNIGGTNLGSQSNTLTIDFYPGQGYTDKAVNFYNGASRADVTVSSVSCINLNTSLPITVPADVYLDNIITAERYYYMDVSATPTCNVGTASNYELPVWWDYIPGAESYDLEWVFVQDDNDPNTTSYDYDFRNASRVSLTGNSYQVPLSFPKGILGFRVRGVGISNTSPYGQVETPWSFATVKGNTSTQNFNCSYTVTGLDLGMNWQYSAAFAEDGKRKEIINYYDGSLRNRQSSTYLSTNKQAIIGESKYDYQGRPTVQILPTPVSSTGIHYYSNFNSSFDRTNFDTDAKVVNPDAMGTTSGAGQYYSTSNPDLTGTNAFIPDAQGYPYSQIVYMNDGTGRPKSVSGFGIDHKLGSTHETKYYYGTPTGQEELDRLFGNEIGYMSHYKKNMVMDANGQLSVSYIDMYGRVVATALAGSTPTNLLEIDNKNPSPQSITTSLLGNNSLNNSNEMVSTSTITVSSVGNYTFNYSLTQDQYCSNCLPTTGGSNCKDCMYDVEITVRNQDGSLYTGMSPNPKTFTNISSQSPAYSWTLTNLPIGVYTVTKVTKLNSSNLQTLTSNYQVNQNCLTAPGLSSETCPSCSTLCEDNYTIKDAQGNILSYIDDNGIQCSTSVGQGLIAACRDSACNPKMDPCDIRYKALLGDMSPGGQYFDNLPFKYDNNLAVQSSYFSTPNGANGINGWMTTQVSSITNFWSDFHTWATNNCSVTANLTTFSSWNYIRANWKDCFGQYLIKFHPEYCYYRFVCGPQCTDGSVSYETLYAWDKGFQHSSGTGNDAAYMNPFGLSTNTTDNGAGGNNENFIDIASNPSYLDPFLCDKTICSSCSSGLSNQKDIILQMMKHYLPTGGGNYHSIWYVLAGDHNIVSSCPGTIPASVCSLYVQLYGTNGIFTTGTMTKFQYFRNYYNFCKSVVMEKLYQSYSSSSSNPPDHGIASGCVNSNTSEDANHTPVYDHGYLILNTATPNAPIDVYGFNVNFPPNPVTIMYADMICGTWTYNSTTYSWCNQGYDLTFHGAVGDKLNNYTTASGNKLDSACVQTIRKMVEDAITTQVKSAWGACGMSTTIIDSVRIYLRKVAHNSCMQGSPNGLDTTTTAVAGPGTYTFKSFRSVMNYFNSHHSTSCPYPKDKGTYLQANCGCDNFHQFMNDNGYTTATSTSTIATQINALFNPTTAYTSTQVGNWITECNKYLPSQTTLNTNSFPPEFTCAATEPDNNITDYSGEVEDECDEETQTQTNVNNNNSYNTNLAVATLNYIALYTSSCLGSLPTKETFTLSYTLDEYQYTLYYYDQAGGLIKTVPPEGVNVITSSGTLTSIQTVRNTGNSQGSYIYPTHTYVTNYKYNSLDQLVYQKTPDAGVTDFWYDALGRQVANRNAKQASMTPNGYSYTLYDDLSRVKELGQVTKSAAPTTTDLLTNTSFASWVSGGTRSEITTTLYDETISTTINSLFGASGQQNLRNRVATVKYEETYSGISTTYLRATHYSYDIHGNVSYLIQDIDMGNPTIRARTQYKFDLISGNVNEVNYQKGYKDEMNHKYYYDADNRITRLETSTNGILWDRDIKYLYYKNGLLARTEIADKQVQGIDNAYTIHNWIKGVNSTILNKSKEMGQDGYNNGLTVNNLNQYFGTDAFSYTLCYFNNDYKQISNPSVANATFASMNNTINAFNTATYSLFNGNISSMVSSMLDENQSMKEIQGSAYRYDQLNRIKRAYVFRDVNLTANNYWGSAAVDNSYYKERYSYDRNGNIDSLKRWDNTGTLMDKLHYKYQTPTYGYTAGTVSTNKLRHINDDPTLNSVSTVDIDDQGAFTAGSGENYDYDEIGNLKKDVSEGISSIEWTVYGKVKKVTRNTGNKVNLEFLYDGMGNRVCKIAKPQTNGVPGSSTAWVYTYYSRDAQGNVLAIYTKEGEASTNISVLERNIYGSSRVGVNATIVQNIDFVNAITPPTSPTPSNYTRKLSSKQFEMTNHLGNVLVVVNDRKLGVDGNSDLIVDYYTADVVAYQDYYSFGMLMSSRSTNSGNYKYGFNGKENDNEVHNVTGSFQDYGFRMYDSRLCRFMSTDPLEAAFPFWTPYQFAGNTPIWCFDLDGLEPVTRTIKYRGIKLKVHMDKSRPQEFTISWGFLSKTFDFYTTDDRTAYNASLYGAVESMALLVSGHIEDVRRTRDTRKLRFMHFGPINVRKVLVKYLEENPDVSLVVVGNHMVGKAFYEGYDDKGDGIPFEPNDPNRELHFTRGRAETIRKLFFQDNHLVRAMSVMETNNTNFPNANFIWLGSDANGTTLLFDTHESKIDEPTESHRNPRMMVPPSGSGEGQPGEYEKYKEE